MGELLRRSSPGFLICVHPVHLRISTTADCMAPAQLSAEYVQ